MPTIRLIKHKKKCGTIVYRTHLSEQHSQLVELIQRKNSKRELLFPTHHFAQWVKMTEIKPKVERAGQNLVLEFNEDDAFEFKMRWM